MHNAPDGDVECDERSVMNHVFGKTSLALRTFCESRGLPAYVLWSSAMRGVGFQADATYLIRPVGYVGLAGRSDNVAELERYLDRHQIRPSIFTRGTHRSRLPTRGLVVGGISLQEERCQSQAISER